MMEKLAILIEFKALPGQRDALAAHLASAGAGYASEAGTESFMVHLSLTDADTVVVYERYSSAAAKQLHESAPRFADIRAKTGSFLAGAPVVKPLNVVGGKP
jgi:quinol monooxygenase YgiN